MSRVALAFGIAFVAAPASAQPTVGKPAPDFVAADAQGKPVKLSDFRGRTVVLEWTNPGCPFVQKHYDSGNMQHTQTTARTAGAVWLTINSGAPGKQGHLTGPAAAAYQKSAGMHSTAYLLDPKGVVGKAYAAKTTPHLYVIDGNGMLVYMGAIDDKPTADQADIKGARNHVLAALSEVKAGKPISVPSTKAYGCSVKYSS